MTKVKKGIDFGAVQTVGFLNQRFYVVLQFVHDGKTLVADQHPLGIAAHRIDAADLELFRRRQEILLGILRLGLDVQGKIVEETLLKLAVIIEAPEGTGAVKQLGAIGNTQLIIQVTAGKQF